MNFRGMSTKQRGSSLIEILVVIVIFTVGILAAVQVFPGGLAILRQNRSNTVANALARAEMERLKEDAAQMPDAILSVTYPMATPTVREVEFDLQRTPNDLNPPPQVTALDQTGQLSDVDGGLGSWWLFSGANTMRQIVGEGRRIPAPRFVDGPTGARYGGVLAVQFGPLFLNFLNASPADPTQFVPFVVYGNDLVRRITDADLSSDFPLREDYVCFVEDDGEYMTVPQGPYRPDLAAGALTRSYRVSARVQFSDGSRQDLVRVIRLPAALQNAPRFNLNQDLRVIFAGAGPAVTRVEPDTVQVARLFEEVTTFLTEAQIGTNAGVLDDAVYQYQRLNDQLGVFLFHPQGAQYTERRTRGRLPLRARVDYNVLDWRNIRDDFRVPRTAPYQQKLLLESLKVAGNRGPDNRVYTGLGFQVSTGPGLPIERDFVVMDRETGATLMPNSYRVDMSTGVLTFIDVDNNIANGLSSNLVYAGSAVISTVDDVRNRAFRAFYQANGEYAIQPVKAFSRYRATFSSSLGAGQCYIGGTDIAAPTSLPTRVYFPLSDLGKKVVVSEIWYTDGGGVRKKLTEQEFIINAPGPTDWNRYGYLDIREKDPTAVQFDYNFGYAVRNVRGASVGVRVLWNPASFSLTADPNENLTRMNNWLGQMRRITTETFLMKDIEE